MTIRDRLTRFLLAPQIRAMEHTIEVLELAWRRGPALMDERALLTALQEADSYLVDYILQQRGYQLLTQQVSEYTEEDRLRVVDESRHMYRYDVQTARAVNMWTDFGFGQSVEIVPRDKALAEVWDEFWSAKRNAPLLKQRKIHRMSNAVINDGELFFVFFGSAVDGKTTIRRLGTRDVSRIVYEKDDPDVPLFYVKATTGKNEIWYPDWCATKEQLGTIELPRNAKRVEEDANAVVVDGKETRVTNVKVLHVAYDEVGGRGWPLLSRVYVWSRVLRNFLGDRAAVSKRVAMFVDELTHAGGSRAQDAIEAKFQSALDRNTYLDTNPSAPAGSTLVHNKALEVARRPLTTGAGDAMSDGQLFAGQVSAGTGIPLHWMGMPQALANRATAREMARPWNEQLERYQTMWSDVFQDMVEIVGENTEREYEDYTADISLQSPLGVDVEDIAEGMSAITEAFGVAAIDPDLAVEANNKLTERMLVALGIPRALDQDEIEESQAPEDVMLRALAGEVRAGRLGEEDAWAVVREAGMIAGDDGTD